MESKIFDAIITVYIFIKHISQNGIAKNVNNIYYKVTYKKIVFLIKLYEICHQKILSKAKKPLKPIIWIKLFEKVYINLIDIRSTSNITIYTSYMWINLFICYILKLYMLFVLPYKKAIIVV